MERRFQEGRRVLSFQQYLELFAAAPGALRARRRALRARHVRPLRDARRSSALGRAHALPALRSALGARASATPRAPTRATTSATSALVGQEELQAEIYRSLCELRAGGPGEPARPAARPERLGQEHGRRLHPARARALLDARRGRALPLPLGLPEPEDGARLHRLRRRRRRSARQRRRRRELRAPRRRPDRRAPRDRGPRPPALPPPDPRARALLVAAPLRRRRGEAEPPPDWLLRGKLSHKNQQVFEALLASYNGSLAEMLRHVQVERYFISRRYRVGRRHDRARRSPSTPASGRSRPTARSRRCPTSLQAITLFEAHGELDRGRGRRARVQRSPEAPARRLPVPPALARDGRGAALRSRPCSSTS